jgi:cell shape-determining protein MreC
MTYHFVKRKSSHTKSIFITSFCVVLLIVLFWPSGKRFVYTYTESILVNIGETVHATGVIPQFVTTFFSSRKVLYDREKVLEEKVQSLENEVTKLRLTEAIYRDILLGDDVQIIAMNSFVRDVTYLYGTVMFNKGFEDGVIEDGLVFLSGREAVCRIQEVYKRSSLCSLFSSYGNSVEGVTASSSIPVTLEGRGGHYIANMVRDTPIILGESILLRDNQTFILGTIVEIIKNDQDTFLRAFVRPSHNPNINTRYFVEKSK